MVPFNGDILWHVCTGFNSETSDNTVIEKMKSQWKHHEILAEIDIQQT